MKKDYHFFGASENPGVCILVSVKVHPDDFFRCLPFAGCWRVLIRLV